MGMDAKTAILEQKTALGIELGSTRIKAVLIGADNAPIASGDHEWENRYDNGVWTYTLEDIWTGLQDAYTKMAADVTKQETSSCRSAPGETISQKKQARS